jgi:uncharacterized protein YecE (DUF72 family)
MIEKIGWCADKTKLGERFALEFRNEKWFSEDSVEWAKEKEIIVVSVDAPELPRTIFDVNDLVYLRMHGRTSWYSHYYSRDELKEVASKIVEFNPNKAYIYFNNNHAMLENARQMKGIIEKAG